MLMKYITEKKCLSYSFCLLLDQITCCKQSQCLVCLVDHSNVWLIRRSFFVPQAIFSSAFRLICRKVHRLSWQSKPWCACAELIPLINMRLLEDLGMLNGNNCMYADKKALCALWFACLFCSNSSAFNQLCLRLQVKRVIFQCTLQ